jgi:hypothetical protein
MKRNKPVSIPTTQFKSKNFNEKLQKMKIPEKYRSLVDEDQKRLLQYNHKKEKKLNLKKEKFYKEQRDRIKKLIEDEKDIQKVRNLEQQQREELLGKRPSLSTPAIENQSQNKIESFKEQLQQIKNKIRAVKDLRELEKLQKEIRMGKTNNITNTNTNLQEESLNPGWNYTKDQQGKIFDKNNNPISLNNKDIASAKINQEKFKAEKIKNMLQYKDDEVKSTYGAKAFDENIRQATNKKRNKTMMGLGFSLSRNRKRVEKPQMFGDRTAMKMIKKTGKLSKYSLNKNMYVSSDMVNSVPEVEWWDKPFVNYTSENYMSQTFIKQFFQKNIKVKQKPNTIQSLLRNNISQRFDLVKTLLQDDTDLQKVLKDKEVLNIIGKDKCSKLPKIEEADAVTELKTYKTRQEIKKEKRETKLQKMKDIQEKIKYGILPAPEPKLKLSNFMSVLKEEALQDPTKVEMTVRKAIEARQKKHQRHNLKRKKQKMSNTDKRRIKANRDLEKKSLLSVYKIHELQNFENQYKVNSNARKFFIQGFCLVPAVFLKELKPIIVTFAGEKHSQKYHKLLTKRIKWTRGNFKCFS